MSERARDVPAAEVDALAGRDVVTAPAARKHTMALSEKLDLSFAVWLSRQLRRQRISQRELARRGGLDHSTISRILMGARAPSWSTMQRIAQVVGFPPPNVLLGAFRLTRTPDEEQLARSQLRDER
jgi:DNA-binding XRE family transcriptional regulator